MCWLRGPHTSTRAGCSAQRRGEMSETRTLQHTESGELTIADETKLEAPYEKIHVADDAIATDNLPDGGLEAWFSMIGA